MSYINTVAAKKVLDDMSVLSPVVKDLESVAGIATQLVFMFGSEEYLLPVPGFISDPLFQISTSHWS